MKGTLFSADFIKDSSDNLRLLELNTDTAFTQQGLSQIDFTDFFGVLQTSNIDEVHVIYKEMHEDFVNNLSQSLSENAPFITSFVYAFEDSTTIYPSAVEDASNKFILRLAYDESAIFDSTYCKSPVNTLSLFSDAQSGSLVPEFFISSSEYFYNNLNKTINSPNIPDVIVKPLSNIASEPNSFYKIGKSTESLDTRWSLFTSSFDTDNLVINFYEDSNDTKVKSIRSFNIIYGSNLDLIKLGTFEVDGLFEKPTSIAYDDTIIDNKLDIKHYYELTTTHPKWTSYNSWGGIFGEEQIIKSDGTSIAISNASTGDSFKSYFISGSPDTDIPYSFMQWSYPGNELPSGSFETSSILIDNLQQDLSYNIVVKTTVNGVDSFRANGAAHVLVYDSNQNVIRYEEVRNLDTSNHFMFDVSGSLLPITDVTYEVLDGNYSVNIIDMETTDTFFINSGLGVKIVTHNCFPAGTEITLEDGSHKNIEDLTTEDVLLTYNEKTNEFSKGTIGNIVKKKEALLIHLSTGKGDVKSTPLHRFYVKGRGWIHAQDIVVGDILIYEDSLEVLVTNREDLVGEFEVYHILDVKDNHTYFAQGFLVHNLKIVQTCFAEGTQISLSNGDTKNIEDVVIGDEVLGWNGESFVSSKVTATDSRHTVGDHLENCSKLGYDAGLFTINKTNLLFTPEHPFLTKDGWKALLPDVNQEPFKSEQEPKVLEVGDQINLNGEWVSIEEILHIPSDLDKKVYNITVDEIHSYIANGIIVHNK